MTGKIALVVEASKIALVVEASIFAFQRNSELNSVKCSRSPVSQPKSTYFTKLPYLYTFTILATLTHKYYIFVEEKM